MDEWELAPLHERFAHSTLSLSALFAQFNEYRQFFPNLIFVVAGYVSKGDLRLVMYITFVIACLISYNVYKLSETTLHVSPGQRWWLFAAANVLIFSPVPVENWLQGQQLIYFVPAVVLTTCLRIAYGQNSRPYLKLLLCGLLCLVSTFSSANGFICWLLMAPLLIHGTAWSTLRPKSAFVGGWLIALALCLALYLTSYQKPATHPALTHILAHQIDDLIYFVSLLGRPFAFGRILVSIAMGALLLVLFIWAVSAYLRRLNSENLCWLILGAYSLATAFLIMIGRAGLGLTHSLTTRYATFTLFLPVALVYLFKAGNTSRAAIVALLLIVVHIPLYIFGVRNMRALRAEDLYGKACVHFINVIDHDNCQTQVFPDRAKLRAFANSLDRLGYLRPSLATSASMHDLTATNASAAEDYGSFVELKLTGLSEYTASGVARLPQRHRPADAVLLACEDVSHDARVFGVARMSGNDDAHWSKTFNLELLPAATCNVTAWAFDAGSRKAFRLSGAQTVAK